MKQHSDWKEVLMVVGTESSIQFSVWNSTKLYQTLQTCRKNDRIQALIDIEYDVRCYIIIWV